jgi:hypothetical protein
VSDETRPAEDHGVGLVAQCAATFIDYLEGRDGDDVRVRDVAIVAELADGETVRVLSPDDTSTAVGLLSRAITVLAADRRGSE